MALLESRYKDAKAWLAIFTEGAMPSFAPRVYNIGQYDEVDHSRAIFVTTPSCSGRRRILYKTFLLGFLSSKMSTVRFVQIGTEVITVFKDFETGWLTSGLMAGRRRATESRRGFPKVTTKDPYYR